MKSACSRIVTSVVMMKKSEKLIVLWSFIYFFSLLSGYFILRPIRDEMGIVNGANNMQWLFTGTFVAMLLVVPLFLYITKKFVLKKVLFLSYTFFLFNIIIFYILFKIFHGSKLLAASFFIWLSVFNLFVVSLFWSFMADVFSSESSKRLFGIIAAGGSIGALIGPIISSLLVTQTSIENLFLVAGVCMLIVLFAIKKIVNLKEENKHLKSNNGFNSNVILAPDILLSIKKGMKSKYLQSIILFMIFYTAISTFLYFEQAHIVENSITESSRRLLYFSKVDLITNTLTVFSQVFITSSVIKKYGLKITLFLVPFLIAIGFAFLSINPSVLVIGTLIIVHRAGNFSLLKPSKEILFTVCNKEEKYRVKNFIDTIIYRGGDALTGWLFSLLISFGLGLSIIALISLPVALLWSFNGNRLGKVYKIKEKELISNTIKHDE
ncbi:MFS transporter [Flavivirga aquimarina]|uniref:MFS transporter n=1 Tax=Flavivirga aquimarina TaxID=2027862 RepID=A0ABT8WG52_9FLAO|nr:MFS transporter [Flavivirga aquimarina]MDO5972133.1 MFS transporter [Flavivirga aquimarina]